MGSFTLFDVLIFLLMVGAMLSGYRLGFVTRASSWIGLAAGGVLAIDFLPYVLHRAGTISPTGRLTIVIMLFVLGALLGQIAGLMAGSRLSFVLPPGAARMWDRIGGALMGLIGVVVSLWFVLPAAANVPGWSAQEVRNSQIARAIYENAPKPPDTLESLHRLIGSSSFPSVISGIEPAQDAGPPPSSVDIPANVLGRVEASTVKVEGIACRRTQDGSGFAVGPNLIATNAHVVAGETKTEVLLSNGADYAATVVYFDPYRDLALLRVPRYAEPPLPIGTPSQGEVGVVLGHPGGQDQLAVQPASVSRKIVAVGRDLYDHTATRRDVLVLSAALKQGDSGGAMVNTSGDVIGVAFAIAPDKPNTGYALNTTELNAALAQPRSSAAVSTGACLTD